MDLYPPFREELDKKFSSRGRLARAVEDEELLCHAAAIYHVCHTAATRRCLAGPWPRTGTVER
jgi:hypothetical protein